MGIKGSVKYTGAGVQRKHAGREAVVITLEKCHGIMMIIIYNTYDDYISHIIYIFITFIYDIIYNDHYRYMIR